VADQARIAVIGAGIIGRAVTYALAREGRRIVLFERGEPQSSGASYGNAGHIASEAVEPLPSRSLLAGFWKELFALGGPLDIPLTRLPTFVPWALRFARAASQREAHTRYLAPLVRSACATHLRWLKEIGRESLLKVNGHYEWWHGARAREAAAAQERLMRGLEVETRAASPGALAALSAQNGPGAALWFPHSGHVLDPLELMRALASAAEQRGAELRRENVRALESRAPGLAVLGEHASGDFDAAVVCAGVWSEALLKPFGLRAPLEAARGYHVELPGHPPLIDAPVVYSNEHLVVTPMAGRLRATSYMEFARPEAPADARKPERLRRQLRSLGYRAALDGPSWVGPRPVLPDYLPAIGQVSGVPLYYAFGHHHIGLTTAAVTGELVADLVAQRDPRIPVSGFDLRRFGR
jgi:D-hydroxyproline dehydrogenase